MSKSIDESELSSYSLSYEVFAELGDRDLWIAGAEIRVLDVKTRSTLGFVRKYVHESGMGDVSGGRSPWLLVSGEGTCPNINGRVSWGHFLLSVNKIISPEE